MNSILIVLPILTLLMFDLGLSLEFKDFLMVVKRPRAMFAGMLIACCPGGSSSNVFSKLAGGDVALSLFEDERMEEYRSWDREYDENAARQNPDHKHHRRGSSKALVFSYRSGGRPSLLVLLCFLHSVWVFIIGSSMKAKITNHCQLWENKAY